jgi:hypothetical protein
MNNGNKEHSWRQQPAAQFTVNCGRAGQPACECWPKVNTTLSNYCQHYWKGEELHTGPVMKNKQAPRSVRILSMKNDGSVVKVSFQGQQKKGTLRVGSYLAFMEDGTSGACSAISPVKYRVFVRCLGCSTKPLEFHTKEGVQFTSPMTSSKPLAPDEGRRDYTYEAWFRSPMNTQYNREIFGGAGSGLTLVNKGQAECLHEVRKDGRDHYGYQLHAGSTEYYGSTCLSADTWYHGAVVRDCKHGACKVTVYVNGRNVTVRGTSHEGVGDSELASTVGGGFVDGGQLFNVRIWNHARTHSELVQDALKTSMDSMQNPNGLDHYWPLTDDLKDVITGMPLTGAGNVRSSPIWCSDLEQSGIAGC